MSQCRQYEKTLGDRRQIVLEVGKSNPDHDFVAKLFGDWCDRIVEDRHGHARPLFINERPDIIFIRKDGVDSAWVLGAMLELELPAYRLWWDRWWMVVIRVGESYIKQDAIEYRREHPFRKV